MQTLSVPLPAMYGDHHVIEVRNHLLALPGVETVYASSAFQVVEVTFDPTRLTADQVHAALDDAGYSGQLPVQQESDDPTYKREQQQRFFRHTTAFEQTNNVVGFAQQVNYSERPLWPCPGMGALNLMAEDEG